MYGLVTDSLILTGQEAEGRRLLISIRHDADRRTVLLNFTVLVADIDIGRFLSGQGSHGFCVHLSQGWSADQVARVCEALADRNYQIILGRWERDARDGEIRMSIALPYCDGRVTPRQINWCIDVGSHEVLSMLPEIEKVRAAEAPLRLAV